MGIEVVATYEVTLTHRVAVTGVDRTIDALSAARKFVLGKERTDITGTVTWLSTHEQAELVDVMVRPTEEPTRTDP